MTVDQAIQIAVQHHQAGRLPEAEGIYRQVLGAVPGHPLALHNLGQIAYTVKRFDIAIDLLKQSVNAQPNDPNTHNTLSAALFAIGKTGEAETEARIAIQLNPQLSHPYSNLGNALVGRGDLDGGVKAFEKALALDANNPIAHDGLGATLLMLGDLQRGWREAEWRWQKPDYERIRFPDKPRWNGSDLNGKRLLLMVEQGYGDVFQFCRYAPLLKARGATVIMEVVPDIHRLMSTLAGMDHFTIAGMKPPQFDLACPLLSVPLWYGTTLENIPARVPYLTADARLVESFAAKYFRNNPDLKVGIAWAGRSTHGNDHNRSMTLAALAPLAQVSGITFYSLQKGDAAKQALTVPTDMKLVDLSQGLQDFNWTAAAISGLDLIVTVDTAVCHLAGALGKPVWLLVPFIPDWRWMLKREDTPWYPTMRLFRQKTAGDWANVIHRTRDALQQLRI